VSPNGCGRRRPLPFSGLSFSTRAPPKFRFS
jgi:hypothetical protein